jgi:hypothetical protein
MPGCLSKSVNCNACLEAGCNYLRFRGGSVVCVDDTSPLEGDFDLFLNPGDEFMCPSSPTEPPSSSSSTQPTSSSSSTQPPSSSTIQPLYTSDSGPSLFQEICMFGTSPLFVMLLMIFFYSFSRCHYYHQCFRFRSASDLEKLATN